MSRAELTSWFQEHRGERSRKLSVHVSRAFVTACARQTRSCPDSTRLFLRRWWALAPRRTTRTAAGSRRRIRAPPTARCPNSPSSRRRPRWRRRPSPSWTFRLSPKACRSSLITRSWSKLLQAGARPLPQEPATDSGVFRAEVKRGDGFHRHCDPDPQHLLVAQHRTLEIFLEV